MFRKKHHPVLTRAVPRRVGNSLASATGAVVVLPGHLIFLDIGGSYLVDPASSHMLVSKIKPCMSKYKPH